MYIYIQYIKTNVYIYIFIHTTHTHINSYFYTPISKLQENGGYLGLVTYKSWCKCTKIGK